MGWLRNRLNRPDWQTNGRMKERMGEIFLCPGTIIPQSLLCPWATLDDLGWPSVILRVAHFSERLENEYADEVHSIRSGRGLVKDGRALCIRSKNLMRGFASQGQKVMLEKSCVARNNESNSPMSVREFLKSLKLFEILYKPLPTVQATPKVKSLATIQSSTATLLPVTYPCHMLTHHLTLLLLSPILYIRSCS